MLKVRKQIVLITVGTVVVATMGFAVVRNGNWAVKQVKDSVIYFTNGKQLKTDHFDVNIIGELQLKTNSPLYIFSGEECEDCCDEKIVFLVSPAEKTKIITPEYAPYDYPGKEYSTEDSTMLYESRMFYGQVLPNVPNGIIWYQTMLDDNNEYRKSVYLIKVENEKIEEDLLFDNLPAIETTLSYIRSHKCNEVPGISYTSEP